MNVICSVTIILFHSDYFNLQECEYIKSAWCGTSCVHTMEIGDLYIQYIYFLNHVYQKIVSIHTNPPFQKNY